MAPVLGDNGRPSGKEVGRCGVTMAGRALNHSPTNRQGEARRRKSHEEGMVE